MIWEVIENEDGNLALTMNSYDPSDDTCSEENFLESKVFLVGELVDGLGEC